MAITTIDYIVFKKLKESGLFPPRPSVLELGEAEWYGDLPMETLSDSIESFVSDDGLREMLHQRMVEIVCGNSRFKSWDLAKIFYKAFLDYEKLTAIDFHGTPDARQIDLNYPVTLGEQFDIVLNGGTAEHVFNVFQFFRSTHEFTKPGGLMLHVLPFRGWLEHGFYSFNPTFFWDVALANGYDIRILAYTEVSPPKLIQLSRRETIVELARDGSLGENALLYAVMQKGASENQFKVPTQGYYAGAVSEKLAEAWHQLR
jgi:hypothetical protein